MIHHVTLDDRAIIEEALRQRRSTEPTIPAADVKKFLAKIGEEIHRSGGLQKEVVDRLLQQLHDGEL